MTPRWRLFPKYALLIIALVGGLLIASGATSIYFSWRETERNLIDLQAEKAQAAAARIEQYILDIEHQLGWTTLPALDEGSDPFEPRRTEYQKLFRLVPAITEVAWIDPNGREQVRISRVAVNVDGSNDDYSQAAKFKVAKGGATYYGPVYFRKETEPYMTIARPAGLGGGVTAAEVNLKFVWEVVSRIRIGEKGQAWVVDDGGVLIAHPDISLVLRKTDLSSLPQVAALKQPGDTVKKAAKGIDGAPVLSAHAAIPTLNWTVFVESPETEAFAPLYASILRAGLILGAGLLVSMVASFFVARALVRPLQALQEGAARVGAGELDRRIEIRTGDELEGLAEQFNKMASDLKESYSGLERKVAQRTSELSEALEQQTATAEILRVISDSITDTQPVFDAIVSSGQRLFGGRAVVLVLPRGAMLETVAFASDNGVEKTGGFLTPWPLDADSAAGACILESKVIAVADTVEGAKRFARMRDLALALGYRSGLFVPLLREGQAIGCFAVLRATVGDFSAKEISLAQTFADQGVIAIENVRLFNETKEALDRQTATAEILRVISSSPSDVQPVFDAIAKRARLLCAADSSAVRLPDGEVLRVRARDLSEQALAVRTGARDTVPIRPTSLTGRAFLEGRSIHIEDVQLEVDTEYPDVSAIVKRNNFRTVLVVPMLRDGRSIGTISLFRYTVRPFSGTEIDLVKTFADQAVIAIENVRLFNETNEALARQTATAEILRVISESPTDVQPVFDAIARSGVRLFKGAAVAVSRPDGGIVRSVAIAEDDPSRAARWREVFPFPLDRGYVHGAAMLDCRVVDVADVLETGGQFEAGKRNLAPAGYRAMTVVPMARDGVAVGAIAVVRVEPGPLSDEQIALLKTFADQAVIAIENVRLFNETKEALQQQTATAEVLKVISSSVSDAAPVFETILDSCQRLFSSSEQGVLLQGDDGRLHLGAHHGRARELLQKMFPVGRQVAGASPADARRTMHFKDILADADVPAGLRGIAERIGVGSYSQVIAPMMWEGESIGSLYVIRQPPVGFSDKEIGLLRTFADQAVIAIQNSRLFNETREALEQQTATAEILQVISRSVADSQPVFEAILRSCERLFNGAHMGITLLGDDGRIQLRAHHGPVARLQEFDRSFPVPLSRESGSGSVILDREVRAYEDVDEPGVPATVKRSAAAAGTRSVIFAPLLWESRGIGAIFVGRKAAGAFSAKDVALIRTFADQAVIAIQNARLFNETKEALEQQTATAEILRVMSSSPTDVQPVFDAIADRAMALCGGSMAVSSRVDGDLLQMVGYRGTSRVFEEAVRSMFPVPIDRGSTSGRAVLGRAPVQISDVAADPDYRVDKRASALAWRSTIAVPLVHEGRAVGAISVARAEPGEFAAKSVALLETFARQAVLAIENVRLFNETREALEQQTATAEVLQVISSSVADTAPVFDKILDSCERLFAASGLGIYLVGDDGLLRKAGFRGTREKPERALAGTFPRPLEGTATGQAISERRVVHFGDVLADPGVPEPLQRIARAVGSFSIAFAPMLWEGRGVGAIQVSRDPPAPFSEKELTLLKTFADQAVIAIQNARLFNEIQAKSRELELANKHKSEFLANMSHELRTPLNAIIGFSEVLSEKMFGDVNDKQLEYLLDIHSSGQHLLSLINDILDLSKIEAGRMELDLASTSLPMLLDNCTTLVRERASRSGLVLALEVEKGLGDWVADVRKLKQVVINLLSNAVKFTPAGGRVTLRARRIDRAVEIAVIDTGVGIAKDQQALVFEEFRQAGGDYLRKAEGTGLGLSLARRFVELHGGTMRVESEPGQGSTFSFVLPERVLEAAA